MCAIGWFALAGRIGTVTDTTGLDDTASSRPVPLVTELRETVFRKIGWIRVGE